MCECAPLVWMLMGTVFGCVAVKSDEEPDIHSHIKRFQVRVSGTSPIVMHLETPELLLFSMNLTEY